MTLGAALRALLAEYEQRGDELGELVLTFDDIRDSPGDAWSDR